MTQKKDQVTAHVQLGGMINYIPCSVEVGEVTTLPAGSDASVTNSGDEHQIVLDFGLPKGDKGDQGETGETGKSAYEYAVEQGYEGTEEDFRESLTTIDTKAAQAASAAGAASLSANSANVYATAANNSALEAAQSASNAADSEQNAATSAASAQSHAVNAANSALLAGQAVTSANASASAAATQAANAATSATNAAQMASSASTSASAASASADTASAVLTDPNFVAVAGATEDIATVATNISDVNTVATDIADVSAVSDNMTDISLVANDLENIDEVATQVATWQKPSDWVDIRSGSLPNSVYFLVGHSADYATYPTFGLTATTSTGTYDVFVDGIKQATTASGTATTLNWQTLALTSGWDVTTPSALHTHIVRVTPTTSTATLTGIKTTLGANYGILWAHFNVANPIDINSLFNTSGNNDGTKRCYVLQAVTSYNNEIQVSDKIEGSFHYCYVLKEIPTLVYAGASTSTKAGYRCFRSCYALRKVRLVNFGAIDANSMFMNASAIREIDTQNSSAMLANYAFQNCQSLKKLPNLTWGERAYLAFTNMYALEPTVLHANSNNLQYIGFTGSSGNKVALKGLTVSNVAPFTGASPQINVSYTDLDRQALINLFNSMPTVSASQVCNITGTTGASTLTAEDLAIATDKGWTVTR